MAKDYTLAHADGVEQSKRVHKTNLGHLPEHLTDLYDRASLGLKRDEQAKLNALLIKFQDSFQRVNGTWG